MSKKITEKNEIGFNGLFGSNDNILSNIMSAKEAFLSINGLDNQENRDALTAKTVLVENEYRDFFKVINETRKTHNVLFYTDYDCDGMTSSIILEKTFGTLYNNFKCISNTRKDGYSPKKDIVEKNLFNNGRPTVVIMADIGIVCNEYNLDKELYELEEVTHVVILDHHEPSESAGLPQVDALIDLKATRGINQFKELCTAGLTYELGKIYENLYPDNSENFEIEKLLVAAAIGTVTDMVPLIDLNHHIVREALDFLNGDGTADFYGKPLCEFATGRKEFIDNVTETHLYIYDDFGWVLGPHVNAESKVTGLNTNLFDVMRLQNQNDLDEFIKINKRNPVIALDRVNKYRKAKTKKLMENLTHTEYDDFVVVMLNSPDGRGGNLLGNIANQVIGQYNKPLLSLMLKNGQYSGSMRAPKGCSLIPFIEFLKNANLAQGGGHHGAGGLHFPEDNFDKVIEVAKDIFLTQVPTVEATFTILNEKDNWDFLLNVGKTTPIGMNVKMPRVSLLSDELKDITKVTHQLSKDKYIIEKCTDGYLIKQKSATKFKLEEINDDEFIVYEISYGKKINCNSFDSKDAVDIFLAKEHQRLYNETFIDFADSKKEAEEICKRLNDENRKIRVKFYQFSNDISVNTFWMKEMDFYKLCKENDVLDFDIAYSRNIFNGKISYELILQCTNKID